MEKSRFFNKHKSNFFLIFVFLFLLFNIVGNVSASTAWNNIPTQSMSFNDFKSINLNNYCFVTLGISCAFGFYQVQFTNPDNSNTVTLNAGNGIQTSAFSISLGNTGILSISSFNTQLNTPIIVSGKGLGDINSVSTSFNLYIAGNQAPLQIASFGPTIIYGNDSRTYDLNNFFNNYNKIQVIFNEPLLAQPVVLTSQFNQNQTSNGLINVRLTGTSDDFYLTITGKNNTYSSAQIGGNSFTIIAYNNNGNSNGNPFSVTTFPSSQGFSNLPIRNPISISSLLVNQNVTTIGTTVLSPGSKDLGVIYGNYDVLGAFVTLYNDTTLNGWDITLRFYNNGSVFFNRSDGPSGFFGNIDIPLTFQKTNTSLNLFDLGFVSPGSTTFVTNFYGNKFNVGDYFNLTIFPEACNNMGCINVDSFGNKDQYLVQTIPGVLPQSLPFTFDGQMGFNTNKFFDLNKLFSGYNNLTIFWTEGATNYSLVMPPSGINTTIFVSGGNPIYQVNLFSTGILEVLSTNVAHSFSITFLACNSVGCIPGGFLTQPQTILVNIQQNFNQVSGVTNGFWNSAFNVILGLFPDALTLSSFQKIAYIIITMVLFTALILFFSYKAHSSVLSSIYVSGVIDFLIFIYFIFKGYVSAVIILVLLAIAALVFYLNRKGK